MKPFVGLMPPLLSKGWFSMGFVTILGKPSTLNDSHPFFLASKVRGKLLLKASVLLQLQLCRI